MENELLTFKNEGIYGARIALVDETHCEVFNNVHRIRAWYAGYYPYSEVYPVYSAAMSERNYFKHEKKFTLIVLGEETGLNLIPMGIKIPWLKKLDVSCYPCIGRVWNISQLDTKSLAVLECDDGATIQLNPSGRILKHITHFSRTEDEVNFVSYRKHCSKCTTVPLSEVESVEVLAKS